MRSPLVTPSAAGLAVAMVIVAAYLLAGVIGHDPWKPDEAYTFGLVLNILDTGKWVVPTLAGEPFMEKPPLYYVTAAVFARLFSPWLALHDGARLATPFYVGIAAIFAALSARRLFGPGRGRYAALLLVGCVGLAPHAHEMITDAALLAGFAVAIYGLTLALERPLAAGALLGTGVGIGFLSKGLVEPSMIGLACLDLMVFARYRRAAYLRTLGWAALFALPWLTIWPWKLYHASPDLFMEWFWRNNFGRYFGFADLGADDEPWYYTRTLPWFTLPALPAALAAAVLGLRAKDTHARRGLVLMGTLALAMLAVLGTAHTVRDLYAMPLLLPLAIYGASIVDRMPEPVGLAITSVVAGITLLGVGFAWWVWARAFVDGVAPAVAPLDRWLPAGYPFPLEPEAVAAAAALTVGWVALWMFRRVSWVHLWAANITALWGVSMLLLLPWLDYAKSFREPFADLAEHIAPTPECVTSVGLGEPQRAMLQYVAGIVTLRDEVVEAQCPYVLLQSNHNGKMRALPPGNWKLIWQGARPGETHERFQLWVAPSYGGDDTHNAGKRGDVTGSLDPSIASAPTTRPAARY
jgi:4-amino-4-deoxy-L-arabinose transferase-like glycosyltransferase